MLLRGLLLSDGDSWELPNSLYSNPSSIPGRRGSAGFLKKPYWNNLTDLLTFSWERNLWVQICPWKVYLHLQRKRGKKRKKKKKKRLSFNDQFVVIASPLQKQIRICTFTVSLPQRREIFSSINIWSGLSHLEKLVEAEINSKRPDLLSVSGSLYWTQKYWDRFPKEAQGMLVPPGVVCVPTLCDRAVMEPAPASAFSQVCGWDSSHSRLGVHMVRLCIRDKSS